MTNLSYKRVERWNGTTHPTIPLAYALGVSAALPFLITLPIIGGCAYGDGGIMSNVPIKDDYDPATTLVMMVDIEPNGAFAVPGWFGH